MTKCFQLTPEFKNTLQEIVSDYYTSVKKDDYKSIRTIKQELFNGSGQKIGDGAGRDVYVLPNETYTGGTYNEYVIKLATPDKNNTEEDWNGLKQNENEVERWKTASQEKKNYLLPVVTSGKENYWLVMPKGTPVVELPLESIKEFNEWMTEARNSLTDFIHPHDINSMNTVYHQESYYVCDYGV